MSRDRAEGTSALDTRGRHLALADTPGGKLAPGPRTIVVSEPNHGRIVILARKPSPP